MSGFKFNFGGSTSAAAPTATPSFSFPSINTSTAPQSNSIFGGNTLNTNTQQQPQPQPQPSSSIFGNPTTTAAPQLNSIFNNPTATNNPSSLSGSTLLNSQQPTISSSAPVAPSSQAAIDITHLRPTTKFDQLTKDLQSEIESLDNAIHNAQAQCNELPSLLEKLHDSGATVRPGIEMVSSKLDEVETGLENDATDIVTVRDGEQRRNEGEAKCVFRAVDRLKVPRQYQVGHKQNESITGAFYGGSGLSGWWNNPQTLRKTIQRGREGDTMQLPEEQTDENAGPKSLVELFNGRVQGWEGVMKGNRALLAEIEEFVGGLEEKVRGKERVVNERLNYGGMGKEEMESEREQQLKMLRYVFGEVERSMFEVAGKVGGARDDVLELSRVR